MSQQFDDLSDFIRNQMRMSHIYQLVMLMELLNRDGSASIRDVAKALLAEDISQIEYYERVTKNTPGRVLTKNRGITEKQGDSYHLIGFDNLSVAEVEELLVLCADELKCFVERRDDRIWSHRKKLSGYIPGTLRYEILKRAKYRCGLCGKSAEDKAIEVDYIIPRNLGGTNDISNLQALCYSCNAMKRGRDATDFRGVAESYKIREVGCVFCQVDKKRVKAENELCYVVDDLYPATEHHRLIIPKRHVPDFFDLHQPEINAVHNLLGSTRKELEELDKTIKGFNVGTNVGKDAGQSVFHAHIHLMPRRYEDINKTTNNPRGGIRWAIPQN